MFYTLINKGFFTNQSAHRVLIYISNRPQVSMVYRLINHV